MKILLVDDEPIQRRALRMELTKLTLPRAIASIREAVHGQECLKLVEEEEPDVIFLDLRMPVMGGLEVARVLFPNSEIKIVFLTAFDDFKYAQEAVRLGAVDYLLKPASREDLGKVMRKICGLLKDDEENRKEKEHLLTQLQQVRPFIELEYVNEIIEGLPLAGQAHREKSEILGLKHTLCWCLMLDVEYDSAVLLSEPGRQALKQRVHDILRSELALHEGMGITGRLGFGKIVCFSSTPKNQDKSWCMIFAERVRKRVLAEVRCIISVGVSRCYEGPLDLHKASIEARQALEYKYVYGIGHVLNIDDVGQSCTENEELPVDIDKRIAEAMRLGDAESLSVLLLDVAKALYLLGRNDPALARFKSVEILVLLVRAAGEGGACQQAFSLAQERLEVLLSCETAGDVGLVLENLARELVETVKGVRNVRNQRLVQKAVDYIKKNFDQQITLDDLARQVYLSSFYFSHIFKGEMSATFVEYLTNVRVEAAKVKLRETVVSIGVIAEQVGYNDVNYFSRVFKKVTGQTPTQYREKMYSG